METVEEKQREKEVKGGRVNVIFFCIWEREINIDREREINRQVESGPR